MMRGGRPPVRYAGRPGSRRPAPKYLRGSATTELIGDVCRRPPVQLHELHAPPGAVHEDDRPRARADESLLDYEEYDPRYPVLGLFGSRRGSPGVQGARLDGEEPVVFVKLIRLYRRWSTATFA